MNAEMTSEDRHTILGTPCPFCGQPVGQRCIVEGSKVHPLVPPTYLGPWRFHQARQIAAFNPTAGAIQNSDA